MSDEETRIRIQRHKEMEDEAVRLALEGRWEEAEKLNEQILEQDPNDVEALNRRGKALLELRRYDESHTAYERSLELDPYNRIARKNRDRLAALLSSAAAQVLAAETEREQILPDLFISESGKSAVVPLHGIAPKSVLQRMSRGEAVRLEPLGQMVAVKTEDGVTLGRLDPRIGRRLAEFIQVGNRYAAAIAELDESGIKVFIRETHQHPRLAGRLSFPPLATAPGETARPYIRDLGLHLEALEAELADDEEEEEEEEEVEEEEDVAAVEEEDLTIEEEDLGEEPPEEEGFEEDIEEEI
jgi:tetratricopeptide (TPR) repeat protein